MGDSNFLKRHAYPIIKYFTTFCLSVSMAADVSLSLVMKRVGFWGLMGSKACFSPSLFWYPMQQAKQCSIFLSSGSWLWFSRAEKWLYKRFLVSLLSWIIGLEKVSYLGKFKILSTAQSTDHVTHLETGSLAVTDIADLLGKEAK